MDFDKEKLAAGQNAQEKISNEFETELKALLNKYVPQVSAVFDAIDPNPSDDKTAADNSSISMLMWSMTERAIMHGCEEGRGVEVGALMNRIQAVNDAVSSVRSHYTKQALGVVLKNAGERMMKPGTEDEAKTAPTGMPQASGAVG